MAYAAEDGTGKGAGEEPDRRAARLGKTRNFAGDSIKSTAVHCDHPSRLGAGEEWHTSPGTPTRRGTLPSCAGGRADATHIAHALPTQLVQRCSG